MVFLLALPSPTKQPLTTGTSDVIKAIHSFFRDALERPCRKGASKIDLPFKYLHTPSPGENSQAKTRSSALVYGEIGINKQ
jgi:hypothetical protein